MAIHILSQQYWFIKGNAAQGKVGHIFSSVYRDSERYHSYEYPLRQTIQIVFFLALTIILTGGKSLLAVRNKILVSYTGKTWRNLYVFQTYRDMRITLA